MQYWRENKDMQQGRESKGIQQKKESKDMQQKRIQGHAVKKKQGYAVEEKARIYSRIVEKKREQLVDRKQGCALGKASELKMESKRDGRPRTYKRMI